MAERGLFYEEQLYWPTFKIWFTYNNLHALRRKKRVKEEGNLVQEKWI